MCNAFKPHRLKVKRSGFTLIEMLVVIAIIGIIVGISTPAVNSLKGSSDLTTAVNTISGLAQQARAFAMTNNTYVYLGISEFDAGIPQEGTQVPGTGRIIAAAVASKDGSRGYSEYSTTVPTDWTNSYNSGDNLFLIGKIARHENVHTIDFTGTPPTDGTMSRPAVADEFRLGNTSSVTATPFSLPLGNALNAGDIQFDRVIQFNPQGLAQTVTQTAVAGAAAVATVPEYIEVSYQTSRGNNPGQVFTNQEIGNHFTIQLDGLTGDVRIYRP